MFTEPLFDFESYRRLSDNDRRAARAAHPLGAVENDLTALLGAEARLTVGETLYSAALPRTVESGLALILTGETPRRVDFSRKFDFLLTARHPEPAILLAWFDAVLGILPMAGSAPGSHRIWLEVSPATTAGTTGGDTGLALSVSVNRGRTVTVGKLRLCAELLTVPAGVR